MSEPKPPENLGELIRTMSVEERASALALDDGWWSLPEPPKPELPPGLRDAGFILADGDGGPL